MRVLYVKPLLDWPRTSGHDVYCYYMMRAMAEHGAEVSLATSAPLDPKAVEGARLASCHRLADHAGSAADAADAIKGLSRLQERFRSFWGASPADVHAVRSIATETKADVVIAFGLPTLPYLGAVKGPIRVWAMADEWIYHHLTLVSPFRRDTWPHLKSAAIKGLYERAYAPLVDRAWAVSDTDQRAGRYLAGLKVVDLIPNGVDTDFFHPVERPVKANSAIFWGRLDFEPNIDAVLWFCRHVWPELRRAVPDANFTIIGRKPSEAVEALAKVPGVVLHKDVEDLRPSVCEHGLVVLPMISGGGIKNKLLEGAAMGRPLVVSPRAAMDLRWSGPQPWTIAKKPGEWVTAIMDLWRDEPRRAELGRLSRAWVLEHYSWQAPAKKALECFETSLRTKKQRAPGDVAVVAGGPAQ